MKKLIFLALAAVLFCGCEKEIPLDQEEVKPKIVVNAVFHGNDTIWIHISESRNILYEGNLPSIINANAQLLDANDNIIDNFTHAGEGYYYIANYLLIEGEIYKINISAPDFPTVFATSSIPSQLYIEQVDTIRKGDNMYYEIQFTDNPNQINYYELEVSKLTSWYEPFIMDSIYSYETWCCTKEVFIQNGNAASDGVKCLESLMFTDNSFNGQTKTITAYRNIEQEDSTIIIINLKSLTEDFYKYRLSRSKYQEMQGSPFAQPVQVYSNINNGLGIFGSYASSQYTLVIQ